MRLFSFLIPKSKVPIKIIDDKEHNIEVSHGENYDFNQTIRPSKPEYNDIEEELIDVPLIDIAYGRSVASQRISCCRRRSVGIAQDSPAHPSQAKSLRRSSRRRGRTWTP